MNEVEELHRRLTDAESQLKAQTKRWGLFLRYLSDGLEDKATSGWSRITAHYDRGKITRIQISNDNTEKPLDDISKTR